MKRYLEIKPGSISETIKKLSDDYQSLFKAELEKTGKSLAQMTDDEKKAFFNKIDKMHNAKSEMMNTMPMQKVDTKTIMVVKPGAPKGKENVIRISKDKLPEYQKKGYIEAESFVPEAKQVDELTAGQKKLPLALQKAIKAKEKNEDIASMNPNLSPQARAYTAREKDVKDKKGYLSNVDLFLKKMKDPKFAAAFRLSQKTGQPFLYKENTNEAVDNPYAVGMAAAMKQTGDKPPLKKSTIVKAHDIAKSIKKNEEVELDEQITTKKSGQNTDIFYKGKHIGYYHKSGSKYVVYHDNENDPEDFTQSDEVSSEDQAKKMAVNTAKANGMIESVKIDEQITTKKSGTDTDIFYKGKHIGYYHKSGAKYIVYHDNVDDPEDFTQSDEVSSEDQAKKMAVNTAKANGMIESVEINESERDSERDSGGMYALQAIKAKRQKLEQELKNLNKDDPNYNERAASLKKQIEGQKEIMARKQREVFDSYDPNFDLNLLDEMNFTSYASQQMNLKTAKDKRQALKDKYNAMMAGQAKGDEDALQDSIRKLDMSIKKQEQDLIDKMKMMKKEMVDPERIANLQQRIQKMTADMGKIDMADPKSKTKAAIYKSDINTAQLRLKDLIQKKTGELNKQVKETKMGYKSFKQSLKKEQDKKDPKKTMTGQPMTKVDVDPKLGQM